jgi:hypothetical protein
VLSCVLSVHDDQETSMLRGVTKTAIVFAAVAGILPLAASQRLQTTTQSGPAGHMRTAFKAARERVEI